MHFTVLIWILVSTIFIHGICMESFEDVQDLFDYLTVGRNKYLRPQLDYKEATMVNIALYLLGLHGISAVKGTVTIACFFIIRWKDENLKWTPSYFNDTRLISLPPNQMWKPPLINSNSVKEMETFDSEDLTHVQLQNDGQMLWRPGKNLEFMCSIDTTYFPFDTQVCDCEIISWGYPEGGIFPSSNDSTINLEHLETNSEWDITETKVYLIDSYIVRFRMHFKRKSLFLVATLLLPVIFLAFLNTFVLILPQESGERIGFSITLLLAVVVFMTIAQNILPATASPRLSAICFLLLINMSVSVLIMVSVILISWLNNKPNDGAIPDWIICFAQYITWRCTSRKVQNSISNQAEKQITLTNEGLTTKNGFEVNVTWQYLAKMLNSFFMIFYIPSITLSSLCFIVDVAIGR